MKEKKFTDLERSVMHDGGTERSFTGKYWDHHKEGLYSCNSCGQSLFESGTKQDSSKGPMGLQGWPAFDKAIPGAVELREDTSHGMFRTEAVCSACKIHLGHIFDDSETSTGKHFCINSCSLGFKDD